MHSFCMFDTDDPQRDVDDGWQMNSLPALWWSDDALIEILVVDDVERTLSGRFTSATTEIWLK